jgi:hypothetical protein
MAKRFDTLAEAFDYATTNDAIIHRYFGDFYAVGFAGLEWAERVGMKMVHDFSAIGAPKPYHDTDEYRWM